MWHDIGIGVGQRRKLYGGAPLSISAPGAMYFLNTAQPYTMSGISFEYAGAGADEYTVTIAVTGGGTFTAAASSPPTVSNDGTANVTFAAGSTLAQANSAINGGIAGLSSETATATITITNDATAEQAVAIITLNAYAALAVSTLLPADNATDFAADGSFTVTFTRPVQAGSGDITLKLAGGATVEDFDVTSDVVINGTAVTFTPVLPLAGGVPHAIQIDATAIDGAAIGTVDSFAGIADDTTWNFTPRIRVSMVDQVILTDAITNRLIISSPGDAAVEVYNGVSKLGDATLISAGVFEFSYAPAGVDYDVDFKTVGDVSGDGNEFNIVIAEANEIDQDISNWTRSNGSVTITGGQADPFGGTDAYLVETYSASNTAQYIEEAAAATPSEDDAGFEIWVKSNGHDVLRINPQEETAGHFAAISLTTGEKYVDDAQIAIVETAGSWHRIWYRTINASAPPETFRLYMCKALGDITPDSDANEGAYFYLPRTADGILPFTAYQSFNFELTGSAGGINTYEYTHPFIDTGADVNTTRYAIDVIKPSTWDAGNTYKRVFALPAQAKGSEDVAADFIAGDYADRYDVVVIIPYVKNTGPWWGTRNDGTGLQENMLVEVVTQFSENELACSGLRDDTFVIGYSKSGNGAYSLILRNPAVFGYVCSWDGAFSNTWDNSGLDTNFGTEAHWETFDPLQILAANVASVNDSERLVLLGYESWQSSQTAMQSALDSNSVDYKYYAEDTGDHSWGGGWLENGMSELMLLGGVDIDPYALTFSPADDATDVAADATLVVRFEADVVLAAGGSAITVRNVTDDSTVETFTRDDATNATGDNGGTIAIANHRMTITLGDDMVAEKVHSPQIPATAIDDGQGNSFAGLTGDTAWNFTVIAAGGENTVLLLNFNGSDAATSTTDASDSAHTITFIADAQLDTAIKKFGSASLLLDGTGDCIHLDGSSDFAFGTGDFTVHMFVYPLVLSSIRVIADWRAPSDDANPLWYMNGTQMIFHAGASRITAAAALTTGSWQHICLQRYSGTTRMFVNGVQAGSDYTDNNDYGVYSGGPYFGINAGGNQFDWNVQIDDLHIAKGEAIFGDVASFTVPASERTS